MAIERFSKRNILANPDEPATGDYSYGLYDKTHPSFGDVDMIAYMKRQLRGLRGQRVTMVFQGAHIDEFNKIRKFNVKRTFTINRYSDVFGPGSAYASAIHAVRELHSHETLVTYSLTVEPADPEAEDYDA